MQQNQTYRIARQVADQALDQSSTTLQNLTSLKASVKASAAYKFVLTLLVIGKAAADIDVALVGPSGATLTYGLSSVTPKVSVGGDELMVALTDDVESLITIEGVIVVGSTAGDLQAQAAQTTSQATDTSIEIGSCLEIWQISNTV